MQIINVDPKNPDRLAIKKAADTLIASGLIVYPTDTAYGLGGNALDENVIRKIYYVKARSFSKPTHVVVRDWDMIEKLTKTSDLAKRLYGKFLPGPLTIILPKKKVVPNILTAGLPTVGIRIPNSQITMRLSSYVEFPYTTPSANKSGGKTPYSISDVQKEIDLERIDLVLDAGKLPQILPSTIIDLTTKPVKILREGPIKKTQIEKTLGKAAL